MAQWTERRSVNKRVAGSIPSQGTWPGLLARSLVGGMQEATTHWCFSPSLSSSLSLINKIFLKIKIKNWGTPHNLTYFAIKHMCGLMHKFRVWRMGCLNIKVPPWKIPIEYKERKRVILQWESLANTTLTKWSKWSPVEVQIEIMSLDRMQWEHNITWVIFRPRCMTWI